MIRNQWYIVLESREVRKKPAGFMRLGEKLLFWRDREGTVHCLSDRCIHRGASLCLGESIEDNIRCPFHGLQFDSNGRCTFIPANSLLKPVPENFKARSYKTYEAHGFIWIFWGDQEPGDRLPDFFEDLGSGFSTMTRQDPWNTHYSRSIENQLDVAHLPFIHRKTIGRGGRTVVDGPVLEWVNPDRFKVYVYNRNENGSLPKFPSELPVKPDSAQRIELIFPNLWQNKINDGLRIVVAFVPVDESNTKMYLRLYQKFMVIPVLDYLTNKVFMLFNFRILHEDRRVVITQEPKASGLDIGENLFQADMPIVQYRRRRLELQQLNKV